MKRYDDQKYLAHVRSFPCLVCGKSAQAHHLKMIYLGGMGKKVHDYWTVPLCFTCHDALHRFGDERTWWDMQGVDAEAWAKETWRKYNAKT